MLASAVTMPARESGCAFSNEIHCSLRFVAIAIRQLTAPSNSARGWSSAGQVSAVNDRHLTLRVRQGAEAPISLDACCTTPTKAGRRRRKTTKKHWRGNCYDNVVMEAFSSLVRSLPELLRCNDGMFRLHRSVIITSTAGTRRWSLQGRRHSRCAAGGPSGVADAA
jgi:hypothetical protein